MDMQRGSCMSRERVKCELNGHSFITRLMPSLPAAMTANFNINSITLNIVATGGKTFAQYFRQEEWSMVDENACDLLYFELGTNDVDSDIPIEILVSLLIEQAHKLILCGVKLVIFGEVLGRKMSTGRYPSTRHVTLDQFNLRAQLYKSLMKSRLENNKLTKKMRRINNDIWFWEHEHMSKHINNILANDGVHLNEDGNRLLARSIRGALIKGIKHIGTRQV